MNEKKTVALTALTLVAAIVLGRFLPHLPNLTPVIAICLVSGTRFSNKAVAVAIPILGMVISDVCFAGFHSDLLWIYLFYAAVAILAGMLQVNRNWARWMGFSFLASLAFFVWSNLAVFLFSGMYPFSFLGFSECFVAALPFYRNALVGDLVFSAVAFGIFALKPSLFVTENSRS